jgi:hypothetical protein
MSSSFHDLDKPTYYTCGTILFTATNLWAQPFVLLKRRQQVGLVQDLPSETFRLLRDIAKSEGVSGLFRSGGIAWVAGISRMNYFTAYEIIVDVLGGYISINKGKEESRSPPPPPPAWVFGVAGGASSLVSQLIMAPYSVVSTRLQISTASTRETALAVLIDVTSGPGGVRSLWTGYLSAVVQLGPQHATMWAVSSWLRDAIVMYQLSIKYSSGSEEEEHDARDSRCGNDVKQQLGLIPRLVTSGCGSIVAIFVTSPIEVVRTHRQAMASNAMSIYGSNGSSNGCETLASGLDKKSGRGSMPSSWTVFTNLYRQDGPGVFVRGIVPRCYAHCPGMITMIVGYEYVKDLAHHVRHLRQGD